MQVLLKRQFYEKLLLEADKVRPDEVDSWQRFMFPKNTEDVDAIKDFVKTTKI